MNSDSIKYVLRQFIEKPLPKTRARQYVLPTDSGKIIGLAGTRRSGKTFLMFDTMNRLHATGIERERMVYLNFEDDRLYPVEADELDLVLQSLRELYPRSSGTVYLFLDEVQNVAGWERWARRLQDTEDVSIFITGSSSHLLTRDLSTALRGRSITMEIFPLSFYEYLSFRDIEITPYSAQSESRIRAEINQYLMWGGFPEIVLTEEPLRQLIMEEYASLMLYRDVVERFGVRNDKLMRMLLRYCFRNTATLINVSKLHRDFKSMGLSVSKNTVHEYLSHLEDAFLIFMLPKNEESVRKQEHNPKKMHVIDPGLVAAFKGYPERDIGHKLETAVFLAARRKRKQLYYYSNSHEIDLCDGDGSMFMNTCYSLTEESTAKREAEAMKYGQALWPAAEGMLIYHDYTPGILNKTENTIPAWRYLLPIDDRAENQK